MKCKNIICNIIVVVLTSISLVQASTFINAATSISFEDPVYDINTAINSQDGWTATGGMIRTNSDPGGGSWVLDFTNSVGSSHTASRDLDALLSSGKVCMTARLKWTYDKSGYFSLLDSNGNSFLSFGIGKNYYQSGLYWYVDGGTDGNMVDANMPAIGASQRFIDIFVDLDLNTNLADISWSEIGGTRVSLFTNYALNVSSDFKSIIFGNSKIAAMVDDIVIVTEPATFTLFDFEEPAYEVNSPLNGQAGWVEFCDVNENSEAVMVRVDSNSWVIDFTNATEPNVFAIHDLEMGFDSGIVNLSARIKWTYDKSGAFILCDSNDDPFLIFGIGKNYYQSGLYWYVSGGPSGVLVDGNEPGYTGQRFVEIFIELDLDSKLADISWGEIGDSNTIKPLFTDYAISPSGFYSIRVGNNKIAAKMDDIFIWRPMPVPTYFNFEDPVYDINTAINSQDGWTATGGMIRTNSDPGGGSWVLDFSDSVGTSDTASRDLDASFSSGKVCMTARLKWTYDKSGYFSLLDSNDDAFLTFGIGKNYYQSGIYWYVDNGTDGNMVDANMPAIGASQRFIDIFVDLDLNTNLADISWSEIGEAKTILFTDYALDDFPYFNSIRFGNSKSAAKIDDIYITIPKTTTNTFVDFKDPVYDVNVAINGQDGWSATGGMVRANNDLGGGSWVLDFNDSVGTYDTASRDLDMPFSSGKVCMTARIKWTYDKSGYFTLLDSKGDSFLSFGIGKNYYQSGLYWYIDDGADGNMVDVNMPSTVVSQRFIEIFIDLDLNANLADISWSEIGEARTVLFTDYAINSHGFNSIRFGNSSAPAKIDDISIFCSDYRVFVTKFYPGQGKLYAADFKQLADAGFTKVVDKWQQDLPCFTQGAGTFNMDAMSWEYGLAEADLLNETHTVGYTGLETKYTVPYSPGAWAAITQTILEKVALSKAYPNFKGVVLDFEIYDVNKTAGFAESYDVNSFVNFLIIQDQNIPDPLPDTDQRVYYLGNLGLFDAFVEYQYDLVAEQIEQLRQAVDEINPHFQFGVYGWGSLLEAVKKNLTSDLAPLLDMDARTYARKLFPYDVNVPDRPALKWSLLTNSQYAKESQSRGYPVVFLGGHDPQLVGDNDKYKFTVRQAFNSTVYNDGYWIWTEWGMTDGWLFDRQGFIDALMSYFKESREAIDAGDWTWASAEPCQVADPNATVPEIIYTRDDANSITAWDPLTGLTRDPCTAGPIWGFADLGDVDAIEGNERVSLQNGWIKISTNDANNFPLLKFFVGQDQIEMQLVTE